MLYINKKYSIVVFLGFFSCLIFSDGFIAGTLIKTPFGYTSIEQLSISDSVVCFDENNNLVERLVINVAHTHVPCYICIHIEDECIGIANKQQLYDVQQQKWIAVDHLKHNNFVLTHDFKPHYIKAIEWINEPIDVYCLSVAEHHNFFVSKADVCAHNFPPIVISFVWAFGSGIVEWLSAGIGIAGLGGLYYKLDKKNNNNVSFGSVSLSSTMMPDGPEDEDEKKKKRDEARENHEYLTNKEAREVAKKLRYREVKSHPCGNTRNRPVFTNGKNYISPDVDGHIGGAWKMFNRRGDLLYTMDIGLVDILKIY